MIPENPSTSLRVTDLYLDIHTHTYYNDPETIIMLNIFPHAPENLSHPCYKSVGLHPWYADEATFEQHLKKVEEASVNTDVIAIGEAGLDKTISADYALQNRIFAEHIHISANSGKPMILHCVRSYSEMLGIRKKTGYRIPWIFHWFNADRAIARELIKKNCYLSFGHMLFNDRSKAFAVFPEIPLSNVFFETDDSGYSIREVYSRAASIRKLDIQDLQKQIMDNFARCFHL